MKAAVLVFRTNDTGPQHLLKTESVAWCSKARSRRRGDPPGIRFFNPNLSTCERCKSNALVALLEASGLIGTDLNIGTTEGLRA